MEEPPFLRCCSICFLQRVNSYVFTIIRLCER